MHRDVNVWKVVNLDAHILNVYAGVERFACVDSSAMGSVKDVGDAHSLETSLVDRN